MVRWQDEEACCAGLLELAQRKVWMVMMLCIITVLMASCQCLGPLCCFMSRVSEGGALDVEHIDGVRAKVLVSSLCTIAVLSLLCNVVTCVVVVSTSGIGAVLLLCQLWCVIAMSL